MAKTITLTSTSYEGRYMELYCEQVSNGSSANSSTIKWTLSTKGGGSTWYSTGPTKVVINGTTVYTKDRVEWYGTGSPSNPVGTFPACAGSVSGSVTVPHNNDGTKSISVSFSTAIFVGSGSAKTYSSNWTLDSIPRYAEFTTHKINSYDETSVKVDWGCNSACDSVQYSLNGGSWVGANGYPTYTVTGLSPNTKYNIRTRVRRKDSQLYTISNKLEFTTYDYPYCTDSPNFVIGNPLTLKFYNPLSRTIEIHVVCDDGTVLGGDTRNGTSITGYSNEGWQNNWYKTIPNKTSGKYQVRVIYGSSVKTRNNGNTYSIRGDETPTFSNFTYKDVNADVVNTTGNNQVLVKGFSNLEVTILSSNKMTTRNSATPKNYVASIDNLSKTVNYSSEDVTTILGVVNSSGNIRLNVRAYDSRNLSALAYKDITIYDYEKPVINVDVSRLNNFEDQTTLKVSGTYSRLTIDESDKNTITDLQYRYKEVGGEWNSWTKLNTTITSGKFTCNDVVLSLDNTKAFEFEVQATDKLSHNELTVPLDVGEAIFFISSNKKACYINGELVKGSTVVSDTEPTDGEKIWLQKRKNLYDPKNTYKIGNDIVFEYHGVKEGEKYIFSTKRPWTAIHVYNNANERVRTIGNVVTSYGEEVTIQNGEKFLMLTFYPNANNVNINTYDFTGVQLERGEKILPKKIYTKNDNDLYEEFNLGTNTLLHNEEKLDAFLTKPIFEDIECKNLLYTPYNENNKLTRTATKNDHYWETNYYAYLKSGVTYTFSCEIDNPNDTDVYFLKDKAYTTRFSFSNKTKHTFRVPETGVYFMRLDVNINGNTRKFWNFQIEKGTVATSYVEAKFFNGKPNYTYAEQIIGRWVNGRNLYRKVILATLNGTYTENGLFFTWVAHDVADLDVLTELRASVKASDRQAVSSGRDETISVCVTGTSLQLGASSSRVAKDTVAYVIMEYTKTTD